MARVVLYSFVVKNPLRLVLEMLRWFRVRASEFCGKSKTVHGFKNLAGVGG